LGYFSDSRRDAVTVEEFPDSPLLGTNDKPKDDEGGDDAEVDVTEEDVTARHPTPDNFKQSDFQNIIYRVTIS